MQIRYGGRNRTKQDYKEESIAESKKIMNTVDSNNCQLPEGTGHIQRIFENLFFTWYKISKSFLNKIFVTGNRKSTYYQK